MLNFLQNTANVLKGNNHQQAKDRSAKMTQKIKKTVNKF